MLIDKLFSYAFSLFIIKSKGRLEWELNSQKDDCYEDTIDITTFRKSLNGSGQEQGGIFRFGGKIRSLEKLRSELKFKYMQEQYRG